MNGLTCPKCQGQMRSYERNGVTIDQCSECRGIFLDRGELERLVDAENSHYSAPPPQQQQEPPRWTEPRREEHYGGHGGYGHGKRRKKSFLEEMFD
jgi:Zn-finger nucleic acid-binding protein